jgi:hypothetical protein
MPVSPKAASKATAKICGIRWLASRHPELIVIWHDDFANTYSLLDITDAAVVWDSTVGLEASARGSPVWTAATSRYGLVADVHEVLSPEQLDADGMRLWTVDGHAANRFIAYLVLRDAQMPSEFGSWLPWDSSHPPLGAKLAALLAAGGIPSPVEAIRSQIDVYRQRSVRSNLRHLRGH